jgi:MOSC domain-containing protein YiiM
MQLLSVNVGQKSTIQIAGKSGETGIFKQPVETPVLITTFGLENDAIVDVQNHGGVDQAVYVYSDDDYRWWAETLGRTLAPGTFGENLTISDLPTADLQIGDRLRVGAALLEITAPRIPCSTLAARMGDPAFVKRFRAAERPGLYCRVIEPGRVRAGDPVTLERYGGATITVTAMYRQYYISKDLDEAALRQALAAPLAVRARQDYQERLDRLVAQNLV